MPLWSLLALRSKYLRFTNLERNHNHGLSVGDAMPRVIVLLMFLCCWATPVAAADVEGDDTNDVFIGTGSQLLLDAQFSGSDGQRQRIATCVGCRWGMTQPCYGENQGFCLADDPCPPDHERRAVWFGEAGQPLQVQGTTCVGPKGPRTVADVSSQVDDLILTAVPPLAPSVMPMPVLTAIPARFSSGQARSLGARSMSLGGAHVVLDATVEWVWSWGDGTSVATTSPTITHAWRAPADPVVEVSATWQGWFTVDGLGPFPASGARITQQAQLAVNVHPARTVLLGAHHLVVLPRRTRE